jgi:hypothetical protein
VVQANLSLIAFFIQPSSILANHYPKPRSQSDGQTPGERRTKDDDEEDWEMTQNGYYRPAGLCFDHQVIHDVFATLRGVLTHVELEKRLNGVSVIDADVGEFHVRPDKCLEFCR